MITKRVVINKELNIEVEFSISVSGIMEIEFMFSGSGDITSGSGDIITLPEWGKINQELAIFLDEQLRK